MTISENTGHNSSIHANGDANGGAGEGRNLPVRTSRSKGLLAKGKAFLKMFLMGESERFSALINKAVAVLVFLGMISGVATYWALTKPSFFKGDPDTVVWLLNVDLVILLVLAALLARRLVNVVSGWRRGIAGSKLHVRLVYLFSLVAITPAITMTIMSAFLFHFGVQSWFSEQVRTAVNDSQAVATAYLNEHTQIIRADTLAMAYDIDRQAALLADNPTALEKVLRKQSFVRGLSEAVMFDGQGRILGTSGFTFSMEFESVPEYALREAQSGEAAVMRGASDDRVRALVKMNNFNDTYLYVGRMLDPRVLSHVDTTREASEHYAKLEGKRSDLQITFIMIYLVVAVLILIAAIWFGLVFARRLVMPISSIISTAERMRAGDLSARVPENLGLDEFDYLSRSFNRMTIQLQQQQNELLNANKQLDERRRFIETILAGVSSGVLSVNDQGTVVLVNNSAAEMFGVDKQSIVDRPVVDLMPELQDMLTEAYQKPQKIHEKHVPFQKSEDHMRTLQVRIAVEKFDDHYSNAVITFDDITDLLSAQRKAAWADVARRIAHEIKNPLTPIQLSAERLQRKYLGQIQTDHEIFKKCIGTIIRHVGDIGHMVNEFSSFARMPQPVLKKENITTIIRDILILQEQAHPDIHFNKIGLNSSIDALYVLCDSQQVRQALVNIIQNAIDSIQTRVARDEGACGHAEPGHIDVVLATNEKDEAVICVTDNGLGFPKGEDISRLTEPYVTQRDKGTGLGLAIVKKIMDDHKGSLVLGVSDWMKAMDGWRDMDGATVCLVLPLHYNGMSLSNDDNNFGDFEQDKRAVNDF